MKNRFRSDNAEISVLSEQSAVIFHKSGIIQISYN